MLRKDIQFLMEVEGLKLQPYEDTVGKMTIGYGRNLDDVGISENEARYLLSNDIQRVINDLVGYFGINFWSNLEENIRIVLVSMVYNLGFNGFLKFKNFIAAIKNKDYKKAIFELQNSKRAKQLTNRTELEVNLIKEIL